MKIRFRSVIQFFIAMVMLLSSCLSINITTVEADILNQNLNYTVTFELNGGVFSDNSPNVVNVHYGNLVTKPNSPNKDNYLFTGWYKDSSLTTLWNFNTDTITKDTTIYSSWIYADYYSYKNITFDLQYNGLPGTTTSVQKGDLLTEPEEPTRAGYTFGGWYLDDQFKNPMYFDAYHIISDTNLYAKWIENPTYYNVTFDLQGGTSSDLTTKDVISGFSFNPPNNPTKNGFVFDGWFTDLTFNRAWNFSNDTVTNPLILYAKWSSVSEQNFVVTYDLQDGKSIYPTTQILTSGSSLQVPGEPTKEGYTFDGWYKDLNFANHWNFSFDKVYSNTIIFAKKKKVPTATLR